MYGFTESNTPFFLKGFDLLQVCIGSNEIILNFDGSNSITVMSVDLFSNKNRDFLNGIIAFEKSCIGDKIDNVSRINEHFIALDFSGGARLVIEDDSQDYESVIIRKGQTTYSV